MGLGSQAEGGGVDGGGSLVVCGGEDVWGGRERIPYWEEREDRRGSGGQAHFGGDGGGLWSTGGSRSPGAPHPAWLAELCVFLLTFSGQSPVVQGSGQRVGLGARKLVE